MKSRIHSLLQTWNSFWFDWTDTYNAALFRIVFGGILLTMYIYRHFELSFYFLDSGILALSDVKSVLPEFYRPPFWLFPTSEMSTVVLHSLFLVAIVVMILGVFGRWFNFLVLILHLTFIYRNPFIIYGADIVSSFWLFYLCLIDSRRHLSVWSLFAKKPITIGPVSQLFNSVGQRMFQVQLCVIYGYTGMEKLKGVPWWEGTASWNAMANSQLAFIDFAFIAKWPIFIILGTYFTLLFEIYFPALVWPKRLRPWVLLAGVFFHIMIGLTMGLVFFSCVMTSSYLFFVSTKTLRKLTRAS